MTQEEGWIRYNKLMNELRESIATRARELMPMVYADYFLSNNGKNNIYLTSDPDSFIIGLTYQEDGINILVLDSELLNQDPSEYPLQYEGFQATDLLTLLEYIE